MRTLRTAAIFFTAFAAMPIFGEDTKTLGEILAEIDGKASKIETYSADLAMQMNLGGMEMSFDGSVRGKGSMYDSITNMDLFGEKVGMRTVTGADGIVWTEMDMMGKKTIMKTTAEEMTRAVSEMSGGFGLTNMFTGSNMSPDPRTLLKTYSEACDFESAAAEDLDGTRVYVIAGKLKGGAAAEADDEEGAEAAAGEEDEEMFALADLIGGFGQVKIFVGADDGFMRKVEMLNKNDSPILTLICGNPMAKLRK